MLELFDAVEVHPVMERAGDCEQVDEGELESLRSQYPDAAFFWSVYLHYDATRPENEGFGGLECIADLPTKQDAMKHAASLEVALQAARNVK